MFGLEDDSIPNLSKLTASISHHEGLVLKVYKDTVGKQTIGYGRNLTDNGITVREAQYLLGNDIQSAIAQAEKEDWWAVVQDDDVRARAMCELVFNLGIGKLRDFTHALAYLRAGDFHNAAGEFMDSGWSRQVGGRAKILCAMIDLGTDPVSSPVSV